MEIRYSTEEDYYAIKALWQYCFNDSEGFNTYYFNHVFAPNNTLVCREKDGLKAALQLNPHELKIGNEYCKSSYVVGVSSKPEARGKGYMKALMQRALEEMYNKGEIFSILMPIDSRIYEPYGYSFICDQLKYNINLSSLNREKTPHELVPTTGKYISGLVTFYKRQMANKGIWVHRNEELFSRILNEVAADGGYTYVCLQDQKIKGYIFYYLEGEVLKVREMLYEDKATLLAFINLFIMHKTQVKSIKVYESIDGKLKYLLPMDRINEISLQPFMMGRIINIKKFLETIDFSTNEKGDIRVGVIDNHIKENNKVYRIKYSSESIKIEENEQEPHVILPISYLTGLLTGYLSYNEVVFLTKLTYNKKAEHFFKCFKYQTNYINEFV